jgi:single-strand DNA-binding protein
MIITGLARLGRDAELRYTQQGDAVCRLSLAFNYGKKAADGTRPTQWVDASMWGKRAESLAPHLTKGILVSVVADEPHIEEFVRKDSSKGFKLTARISEIEFAGSRPAGDGGQRTGAPAPAQPAQGNVAPPPPAGSGFNDFEDDLPF